MLMNQQLFRLSRSRFTSRTKTRCVEVVTVKTQIKSLLRKFGCTRTREIIDLIQELDVAHLF